MILVYEAVKIMPTISTMTNNNTDDSNTFHQGKNFVLLNHYINR